jgi:hypothetical protein
MTRHRHRLGQEGEMTAALAATWVIGIGHCRLAPLISSDLIHFLLIRCPLNIN